MKKFIFAFFAFVLCLMVGCNIESPTESNNIPDNPAADCTVIEYDSCEYVFKSYKSGTPCGYVYFTHKGNCRFCTERAERKNKEK